MLCWTIQQLKLTIRHLRYKQMILVC